VERENAKRGLSLTPRSSLPPEFSPAGSHHIYSYDNGHTSFWHIGRTRFPKKKENHPVIFRNGSIAPDRK
jgi:hypothetical protein